MTSISILGAGNVARGIATRAIAAGYAVQLLVRDESKGQTLAADLGGSTSVAPLTGPATGDLVFIALPYSAIEGALAGLGSLEGKIVVDASNPIKDDFSGLAVEPGTSGAAAIAALLPGASVVKAFNTIFAGNVAANGEYQLDLFIAGDDADAKAAVAAFGEATGFRVIDTGVLVQSVVLEGLAWLHIQLQFSRGTEFQSAIVILDKVA
ncbi:NADPH-dependent F420 reductase [Salinibacterium sp. ZJ450]|uniref:NADPH-dependent F420 reductase n=1 Tax=Salinibacterium sp. ZJ450 TaxID=2708338 RepID=UPI00141E3B56|nr:NAD(P)-binding domain-containing protein [Salinibacterium sp. ZJ450]